MNFNLNTSTATIGKILLAVLFSGLMPNTLAQDYIWAPDFPVGTAIPAIEAQDQDGAVQTFGSLKGEKGLLLLLNRSFDW
ncbi:MAG: hypothetical protein QGG67_09485 [Gammaproteobacteria bacterium]|jgi:hypothetical protein|nr:hypothetical protein [Gammaproteobacteria bacterium]MDP6096202.1 hypothetical protein [Gammaproteobacteria bacterium]MDP7455677.1 hypothetical protein [Gammaproteobacteria bacterium]HJO12487.1 hypothetical protein [Gammaproteobacteria bacterium]|tara:strand:+ start:1824 stop:2063 length:240 start_codon:yes stop_codon:yes gene_type:complete